jgi:hypothetical protein
VESWAGGGARYKIESSKGHTKKRPLNMDVVANSGHIKKCFTALMGGLCGSF